MKIPKQKLAYERRSQLKELGGKLRSEYDGVISQDNYGKALKSLEGAHGTKSNKKVKAEIRTAMDRVGTYGRTREEYLRDYNNSNKMRIEELKKQRQPKVPSEPIKEPDDIFAPGYAKQMGKGLNPAENYAMTSAINKYSSVEKMVEKGNNNSLIMKKMGFKEEHELEGFLSKNQSGRMEQYEKGMKGAIAKPGMVNAAMGYKVPHMAMGALGTAGLVSAMSGSKGQQTNAQLYGQQQPYY